MAETFMDKVRALSLALLFLVISTASIAGVDEGIEAFIDDDFRVAIREFKRAIDDDPESVQAHLYLSMSYRETGRLEEAIRSMKVAAGFAVGDEAVAINYMLADALLEAGRPGEVLKLADELLMQEEDNFGWVARNRIEARALEDLGRNSEAIAVHERILGRLSGLPEDDILRRDQTILGDSQVGAGHYDEAIKTCSSYVLEDQEKERERKRWEPYYCLGRAYAGRSEYAIAEVQLTKALQQVRKDRDKRDIHRHLGGVYEKQGKWAEAVAAFELAGDAQSARRAMGEIEDSRGVVLQPEDGLAESLDVGTYYALLIAVQDYAHDSVNDLDHPISDARYLNDVLVRKYEFEPKNVSLLENPDEEVIWDAFANLRSRLGSSDSLVVFYAGHGHWDEGVTQGYWLPADARQGNKSKWISNDQIRDAIFGIKARHTLLISDACFSGGLFKERTAFSGADKAIQELYKSPSRKAMTSGTLNTVPDRSIFLKYLKQRLEENDQRFTTADQLFASFRQAVINNSSNKPQYGVIQSAGDEGGEFVFVRRENIPQN